MPKIYCHINQCDASVQYFAILHAVKNIARGIDAITDNYLMFSFEIPADYHSFSEPKMFCRVANGTLLGRRYICSLLNSEISVLRFR